MNRKGFQRLSRTRLREAKILLSANGSDGAYYLAGYAVECAPKACIAKSTERHDFPEKQRVLDSYTHDVSKLIRVAGLKEKHDEAMRQSTFAYCWEFVLRWNENSRYESSSLEDARNLIEAIENPKYGALQWLKKHY